jgi:hypothetical protein
MSAHRSRRLGSPRHRNLERLQERRYERDAGMPNKSVNAQTGVNFSSHWLGGPVNLLRLAGYVEQPPENYERGNTPNDGGTSSENPFPISSLGRIATGIRWTTFIISNAKSSLRESASLRSRTSAILARSCIAPPRRLASAIRRKSLKVCGPRFGKSSLWIPRLSPLQQRLHSAPTRQLCRWLCRRRPGNRH